MSTTEKFIGESKLVDVPAKKVTFKIANGVVTSSKIAEGAVTTSKIAEGAVTVNALGQDVQLAIEGVEQAGLLVSQELGNSQVIGISQNKLTQEFGDIREEISTLNGEYYSS